MPFDVAEWKRRLGERLRAWRGLAGDAGASAYGALCGMTLWPAVEAARGGDLMMVGVTLGSVAAGVGSNLVAGHLQDWMKRATGEDDVAALAAEAALQDPALRDALDAILERLETIGQARQALLDLPSEREAFLAALREELHALGNLPRFEVVLGGASVSAGRDIRDSVVVVGDGHVVNVRVGGGAGRKTDTARALAAYRQHLWRQYAPLPLRGLDLRASDPAGGEGVGLAQVYVGLDTTVMIETVEPQKRGRRQRGAEGEAERRPLSALEATLRERRLVLLGEPGSGKSTFLSFVTLCLAAHGLRPGDGWLARLPGWSDQQALPIPVVLRDFVRWLPDGAAKPKMRHVWDFIQSRLDDERLGAAAPALEDALDKGQAVVFLDGLDEVPTDAERKAVRDAVAAFAERYERSRFVVTCRTLSYQDRAWHLGGWPAHTLARFDEEKIRSFIDAWYRELARLRVVSESAGQALAEGLALAIERPGLADLAPNPLLLTQMALVHTHEGRLPDARAALYEKTVELLLWRWEAVKAEEGAAPGLRRLLDDVGARDLDLLVVLSALAFEAHRAKGADGAALADIPEAQLEDALRKLHPQGSRDWADRVIATMKLRAGLLLERAPRVYAFPHRTFQEYLAGCHLAAQTDFAAASVRLLAEGPLWREVVLLAVGRLVFVSRDVERPLLLAAELCASEDVADEAGARAAWRAGEVLAEVGTQRLSTSVTGSALARRVPKALTRVIRRDDLAPVERAAAGEVLARLGDPRFRADAWYLPDEPLLGFVEIPAGPFRMGSDKKRDPEAWDDELPEHEVTLRRYFIARYPVTVAQLRAFVEDGGQVASRNALSGPDTAPTDWVMWREALAYAEWLTTKLRAWEGTPEPLRSLLREGTGGKPWCVTLPSEAEWEKAARGSDSRKYPWGDEPLDKTRANYAETGIGAPSAVGCFPLGVGPYGVEELSGNVWEWTRSLFHGYPYNPTDGRENSNAPDDKPRVLRGGAFDSGGRFVRAACRHPAYGRPQRWLPGGGVPIYL
jgi:formylglycine-generating enzyme required for sulfatase activity